MSPMLKTRQSGAWVDTAQAGSVRVNGAWVEFGGVPGPEYETITLGSVPALTDLEDGGQAYNMGVAFSVVAACDGVGVRWRVPDSVSTPPGGAHAVAIWEDGGDRIAYQEFVPIPGGNQDILFDTPASLVTGDYIASVYTVHYVFRTGSPSGLESPSGNLVAGSGRLGAYSGGAPSAPIPSGTFDATYYVTPLTTVP